MTKAVHDHVHVNVHVNVYVNVYVHVDVVVNVIGFSSFACGYALCNKGDKGIVEMGR